MENPQWSASPSTSSPNTVEQGIAVDPVKLMDRTLALLEMVEMCEDEDVNEATVAMLMGYLAAATDLAGLNLNAAQALDLLEDVSQDISNRIGQLDGAIEAAKL